MSAEDQDRDERARRYLSMQDLPEDVELPEPPPVRPVEHRRSGGIGRGPIVAAVIAVLAVAGGAVARSAFTGGHHSPAPVAATSTVTHSPAASSPQTSVSSSSTVETPGTAQVPANARAGAAQAAETFVREVVNTHRSQQQWDDAVSKLCTADYASRVTLANPADIPVQHVTGHGRVENVGNGEPVVIVFVPTSAQGYTVTLVVDGTRWQVTDSVPGESTE